MFQFLGTFSSHPDRQEKPVTPQEGLPWPLQVSMVPGIGLSRHLHGQETCYSGLNKEGAHLSYPTGSPEDSKPKWRMWGRPPGARLLLSFCSASFQRGSFSCLYDYCCFSTHRIRIPGRQRLGKTRSLEGTYIDKATLGIPPYSSPPILLARTMSHDHLKLQYEKVGVFFGRFVDQNIWVKLLRKKGRTDIG